MQQRIYIGVGSNRGDRKANLDLARFLLTRRGIRVVEASPLYETEAMTRRSGETAPAYLNGVFRVQTDLSPEQLLDELEGIERLIGRENKGDWAPRPIDLDILFYGDQIVTTERLVIPHPELTRRPFVLKPLLDIAPDLVHPVWGKTVREVSHAALH